MEKPPSSQTTASAAAGVEEGTATAARSSMIQSLKGCGWSAFRIDKEVLRRRIIMPQYLRLAIRRAINSKDVTAGVESADLSAADEVDYPPECPMIVFVNSKSGGRHGPQLKLRLQQLMGEEQVYDLSDVKPNELIQYGLGCLEQLSVLDPVAKQTREKLRVVVAGGDGTVGWVLGCLGELHKEGRYPVPPVAVIPLGTGNDLSRSYDWGGSFPFAWRAAVKRSLHRASVGSICRLDSWRVSITMPAVEVVELPHSLKLTGECTLDQVLHLSDLVLPFVYYSLLQFSVSVKLTGDCRIVTTPSFFFPTLSGVISRPHPPGLIATFWHPTSFKIWCLKNR